jgi:phosphate transport system protein
MDMANSLRIQYLLQSYEKGGNAKREIFEWSEKLRILQEEVADLSIELIARYQPVSTDLSHSNLPT